MRATLISLVILLFSATLGVAQNVAFGGLATNPNAPVEITADSLEVNQETGTALFLGSVVIGQGALRLSAQEVTVFYTENAQSIERMDAKGGVTLVNGEDAAEADTATYNLADGLLRMQGDVLVSQGQSALLAEEMTLNLNTGLAQMSGRVRTVLQSDQN